MTSEKLCQCPDLTFKDFLMSFLLAVRLRLFWRFKPLSYAWDVEYWKIFDLYFSMSIYPSILSIFKCMKQQNFLSE